MKRHLVFFMLLYVLFPLRASALVCSNEQRVNYQTLASNITTNYTYTEQNGTVTFQITLSNIYEGLIVNDIKNGTTYPYQGNELTITNLNPNTSYRFDIYTSDVYCRQEVLYSHYVNTPPYNPYYQDEVCVGAEKFALCQKWTQITMPYEEFKQKVEQLKKPAVEEPTINTKTTTKSFYDYAIELYLKYYYIVLPLFMIVGITIIYRYNKKNDLF